MAATIHPILLTGVWDKGFALDQHIIQSIPLGEDPFGHPRFDSTRSEIGELMYQFKYNNQYDCVYDIVDSMYSFLQTQPDMMNVEVIIPVPPTKNRSTYQPTFEIGSLLSKRLNVFFKSDVLEKTSSQEAKAMSSEERSKLEGTIVQRIQATRKHNILLIDDVYKSGMTLTHCVNALRKDPNINRIFVLVATKTKNS